MDESDYKENSVLAYIASARQSKCKNDIVNTSVVFYEESQIKAAKELLFGIANVKLVWRRSENKNRENCADIVDLFKKCDDEAISLPRFVTGNYDGFPPVYGYDIIGGVIGNLIDEVKELKSEIKDLKDARLNNIGMLENQYFMKEELLEIKGILKQFKQKQMLESGRRDSVILDNIEKIVEQSGNRNGNDGSTNPHAFEMELHHVLNNTGSPSAPQLSQVSTVDGSENVGWCENERAESPLRIPTYSEVIQETVVVLHETQTSEASVMTGGAVDDQAGAERIEASNGPSVRPKQQLGFDKATRSEDTAGDKTRKVNNTPVTDEDGFTQVNRKNKRIPKASPEDRKWGGDREGQQKGRRPGSVRGTKSVHNSRFKGSARTADIHIGNVDLESDVEDVMRN
ncbi:hypothetical protein Pmani_008756 [Petrolisthes manimaculis]|uniref:Uncharacterized protein n=1 Tax=Petrolisthes manimaculis TaxID=1843537 RepID=A0AAE1U6P8_9EUCA|nr:hypothetical protein Pmani_016146 [Petrolisthes manimaculis]KAK4320377.1 hypothetical protein Pmani_008756 [Petrolisthes manimaculis]